MTQLPAATIEEFEANGAVCLRQVFSPEWIAKIRAGIQQNLVHPSGFSEALRDPPNKAMYFNDYFNWRHISEFRDFAFHSPAAEVARQLMRSSTVTFYHEHVLVKERGALKETPWHQDQAYYPFDGDQVCSIWLPVDDVPLETTLQFVRGSHKEGWFFPRKFATSLNYPLKTVPQSNNAKVDGNVYRNVPGAEEIARREILQWSLSVGDCVVFHMKTLHGEQREDHLQGHSPWPIWALHLRNCFLFRSKIRTRDMSCRSQDLNHFRLHSLATRLSMSRMGGNVQFSQEKNFELSYHQKIQLEFIFRPSVDFQGPDREI